MTRLGTDLRDQNGPEGGGDGVLMFAMRLGPRQAIRVCSGRVGAPAALCAFFLGVSPASAQELQAVAPPPGSPFPIDGPSPTFVVEDPPSCEDPSGQSGFPDPEPLLFFSRTGAVGADGIFTPITERNGYPNTLKTTGFANNGFVRADGSFQAVVDVSRVPFGRLPPPSSTYYWQAVCRGFEHSPTGPSAPRALVVELGSRSVPPRDDEVGLTINNGDVYTNSPTVNVTVAAPEFTSEVRIANDGGFSGAQTFAVPPTYRPVYSWTLRTSGAERLPKTVYLRFVGGSQYDGTPVSPTQNFTDDIILDETAPQVTEATLTEGGGTSAVRAATPAALRRFRLHIEAKDKTSGVAKVQLAVRRSKPRKLRDYKQNLTIRAARAPSFVRVFDWAGNRSRWRRIERP